MEIYLSFRRSLYYRSWNCLASMKIIHIGCDPAAPLPGFKGLRGSRDEGSSQWKGKYRSTSASSRFRFHSPSFYGIKFRLLSSKVLHCEYPGSYLPQEEVTRFATELNSSQCKGPEMYIPNAWKVWMKSKKLTKHGGETSDIRAKDGACEGC